jgi:hypothetical protein
MPIKKLTLAEYLPSSLPEIGEDEIAAVVDTLRSESWSTDAYLPALAVARKGALVTFDRRISVDAVPGAAKSKLMILN